MTNCISILDLGPPPKMYNLWGLDRQHMTLTLKQGLIGREERRVPQYEIDLNRCRTSAMVLDWIMQVAGKSWVTKEMLGDLVLAFNQILRPQANLCSIGEELGPINPQEVVWKTTNA